MMMPSGMRKFVLTAHVTSSVGWLGAVVAYLALVVAILTGQDAETVHAGWLALEVIGWFALVPLALLSLATGIIQSLGSVWGLFRHYWVLFKFLLTLFATIILLLHMPTVSFFAGMAAGTDSGHLSGPQGELLHAGGGLCVLVVTTILSVYKPRGVTPYGWRKLRQHPVTQREEGPRL